MDKDQKSHAEELQAALEDVRRIRTLLDELSESNPLRLVMRPLYLYGLVVAPVVFGLGVISQLVIDSGAKEVWGISRNNFLYLLWGGLFALLGIGKQRIAHLVSKRRGYDYFAVLKKMFDTGYPRIFAPVLLSAFFVCAVLVKVGQTHMLVGIFAMMYGTILVAIPLTLPVPESKGLGMITVIAGGVSLFVWPEYPFYKLAVLLGGVCLGLGIVALTSSDNTG